jgi:prevent-host-death family protein
MTITTLSSREFNQNTSRAKKAAMQGPVFITERGKPAHVLLSIEEYRRLTERQENLIDRMGQPPGIEDVEFEIPALRDLARPADFARCFCSTRM